MTSSDKGTNDVAPDTKKSVPIPRTLWGFTRFILKEIVAQRRWLLLPVWVFLAACALIIFLGAGSSLLPAIYVAF